MDEFEFKRIIYDYIKEICHYSQMQVFATSSYQKNYFQLQIDDTINGLINFIQDYYIRAAMEDQYYTIQQQGQQTQQGPEVMQDQKAGQNQSEQQELGDISHIEQEEQKEQSPQAVAQDQTPREFTLEELSAFNGSGGKPAYVVVNGTVYDVSNLLGWGGGTHFGQYAGKDLSNVFMACHNQMTQVLNNVPKVGTLKK